MTATALPSATLTASPLPPTLTPTQTPIPSPTSTPTITPLPNTILDEAGIAMVLVPAGEFTMGRNDRDWNERPAHMVYLDDYYIDQFETTNLDYARFLNEKGNQFEGLANWIEAIDVDLHVREIDGVWQVDAGYEKYPMIEVTWYGARAFCQWRGAALPSEAQWEKAARGVDGRLYPWGDEISCDYANFGGCVYDAVPVDSYPNGVSPYGAYNMAGNVQEWINDIYDSYYYTYSPAENPPGADEGSFKVFRGGSWYDNVGNVRTTYRYPKIPVLTYKANGFRCARDASP